nr:hypothetical protein [Tanacetum cinerariifolium]
MQFLMGLDDLYLPIRINILIMDPLPGVKTAFALISGEESHRGVAYNSTPSKPHATSFVSKGYDNKKTSRGPIPNLKCTNCFKIAHTIERCFELNGYPSNYTKLNGQASKGQSQSKIASNNNAVPERPSTSSPVSLTNEQMLRFMNLINDKPASSISANRADKMSQDMLTVGSTMRIPLLYRGEYSQWVERFMNYFEEQTDEEAMINSIKNGDQPLPRVTQVSIAATSSTKQPPLKDKSMWSDQEKKIQKIDRLARSLLIQGLSNDIYSIIDSNKTAKDLRDALARHMLGSEYGEQDRKAAVLQNKNLMDINIDALYNILKQNQGDVNDVMGLKKKTVVVTSDPLALIADKTDVSKRKEKVVVFSDSEGSDADDFSELKKITTLLAKAFHRRKFYSKPTNNNLRISSTSQSANKKQEFVKLNDKKVEKKDDEKRRDMSKVKFYNCKKEGHFAKDCKKVKFKDYEYYKTKMLLAKKDKDEQVLLAEDQAWMESSSDSDQEINANMVFMAQIDKVLSDSEDSTTSADDKISEQNQGDVNDALGYKKKVFMVTSNPLALVAKKTNVSKRKEKVVVSSDYEGSGTVDFSELKKITALLTKAFNRRKFYSKPTNNNLRTLSTSHSANKKQEFVKTDDKKVKKKANEKKRDLSKVKCYNCKKEGHFANDCKQAKVKDYNYYKTKMLLAKKDSNKQVLLAEDQAWMESSSDSDQEINANMVFMAQIEKVFSESDESSSSAEETIAEVAYYTTESESESEFETLEYYNNSTNYCLFVNNDDDQEIFHDAIESASENFIENHIDSQKDYDKSEVDHNDSEEKEHLVNKLI